MEPWTQNSGYSFALTTLPCVDVFTLVVFKARGARKRSSPSGGSAYGMPRYAAAFEYVRLPRYFAYPRSTTSCWGFVGEANATPRRVRNRTDRIVGQRRTQAMLTYQVPTLYSPPARSEGRGMMSRQTRAPVPSPSERWWSAGPLRFSGKMCSSAFRRRSRESDAAKTIYRCEALPASLKCALGLMDAGSL